MVTKKDRRVPWRQGGRVYDSLGKSKRPIKFAEGLETKAKMQNNTKFLSRLAKQVIKEMKEGV